MSKKKTNWSRVINLLCICVLSCMMGFIVNYIDMQAKRIDYLEIENIKHRGALHVLLPSIKEETAEAAQ